MMVDENIKINSARLLGLKSCLVLVENLIDTIK